jgi:hypothetical protein
MAGVKLGAWQTSKPQLSGMLHLPAERASFCRYKDSDLIYHVSGNKSQQTNLQDLLNLLSSPNEQLPAWWPEPLTLRLEYDKKQVGAATKAYKAALKQIEKEKKKDLKKKKK